MAVQPTELSLQCHRLSLSRLLPECPVFRAFEVVASNWNSNNFLPFGDRMNGLIRQDSVTVCNTNRSVLSGRQFSSDTYRRIGQDLRTKALVSRNDGQECSEQHDRDSAYKHVDGYIKIPLCKSKTTVSEELPKLTQEEKRQVRNVLSEEDENRWYLWRPDQAGFDSRSIFQGALVEE